jgi:hypothetical protein
MGKRAKEHKKRVARRNEQLKQLNNKYNKMRNEIFKQIMLEKDSGVFNEENLKELPSDITEISKNEDDNN